MHWLKNALGWGLLVLAGILAIAIVAFIVIAAIVTIWIAGGTGLIWLVSGEISPVWHQVPTLHARVGFSCLGIMAIFFTWTMWDELKWKMRL